LFEFKRDADANDALKQIDDKGYAIPFSADKRILIKIGASFSSSSRLLVDWKESS
jgi:hypothetical protein